MTLTLPLFDEFNYGQSAIKDKVIIKYLAAAFLFHYVSLYSSAQRKEVLASDTS